MFPNPSAEEDLTIHIEIDDEEITPDVFQECLRFLYTGHLSIPSMETFFNGLFVAAGKYKLEDLEQTLLKVDSYVKRHSIPSDCNLQLITHLEKLFDGTKFSDGIFNVRVRQSPSHKSILAASRDFFDAMFQHPLKEKLSNEIKMKDIEREVFHELLRLIYTGRLSITTMEKLTVGLLMAADKYMLKELVRECTVYLINNMSPVHCVELILHLDLLNPPEYLKNVFSGRIYSFEIFFLFFLH